MKIKYVKNLRFLIKKIINMNIIIEEVFETFFEVFIAYLINPKLLMRRY